MRNWEGNVIEVVNIDDTGDLYCFELEQGNCPFEYYRILSKKEFELYLKKVQELKDMGSMFNQ